MFGDFPGEPLVENPPSNAGDVGLIPGRELINKIPRAAGQQAPKLQLLSCNRCSAHGPQPEKARTLREDPARPKHDVW